MHEDHGGSRALGDQPGQLSAFGIPPNQLRRGSLLEPADQRFRGDWQIHPSTLTGIPRRVEALEHLPQAIAMERLDRV